MSEPNTVTEYIDWAMETVLKHPVRDYRGRGAAWDLGIELAKVAVSLRIDLDRAMLQREMMKPFPTFDEAMDRVNELLVDDTNTSEHD